MNSPFCFFWISIQLNVLQKLDSSKATLKNSFTLEKRNVKENTRPSHFHRLAINWNKIMPSTASLKKFFLWAIKILDLAEKVILSPHFLSPHTPPAPHLTFLSKHNYLLCAWSLQTTETSQKHILDFIALDEFTPIVHSWQNFARDQRSPLIFVVES